MKPWLIFTTRRPRRYWASLQSTLKLGSATKKFKKRQQTYGKNVLKVAETPLWRKLIEPFVDIFMIILVVALVLSAIQQNWIEAITIGVIIAVDAIIYYTTFLNRKKFLNPSRTALSKPSQSCVTGKNKLSNPLELVPGDIVILREGDRIPADGRIVSESGLLSNESHAYG